MNDSHLEQSKKVIEQARFVIPGAEAQYDKYFQKVTELRAGDLITRADCKLCNHPLRSEAEQQWERSKGNGGMGNYSLVVKFLNEKIDETGVKFNYPNVRCHLTQHYEQQIKRVRMREYGRHLAEIINYKVEKDEMFEGIIQSLQWKLFEIASDAELCLSKQVDMMAKLTKSIVEVSLTQAKLRGDIDILDVYKEKVQNIMVNFIASEPDEDKQRELLTKLDVVRSKVSENM